MSDKVKIFYLGAGHIGIPILERLMASDQVELCGVGSQKKAPKIQQNGAPRTAISPLAKYCRQRKWAIELYDSVNAPEFREMLRERGVELLVVVSYGQILKPELLAATPLGCLNVHASLLPKYRGAAPIVAALVGGESRTGVSFMKMEAGLDTGPVYRTVSLDILSSDTAESLEERLGILAGNAIGQCIYDIARRGLQAVPQSAEDTVYARKITKLDCRADWNEPAVVLERKVRAYYSWPSLQTILPARNGKPRTVKLVDTVVVPELPAGARPGDILAFGKDGILIACGEGALRVRRLVPVGKREMSAWEYLLGNPLPPEHLAIVPFEDGENEKNHH